MKFPAQYFRAGVGAAIVDRRGWVLALERADLPGAWQLPQGGMERSEAPLDAAKREVNEETGIREKNLDLLDSFPEPLVYELPVEARTRKSGRGQVQYWFLFKFKGRDLDLDLGEANEFRQWKWMPFSEILKQVVEFRRPVYQRLQQRFEKHFS
jgi:putative (di)nucleoside polyphosphate hydrolase